jgi:hypothetical protein
VQKVAAAVCASGGNPPAPFPGKTEQLPSLGSQFPAGAAATVNFQDLIIPSCDQSNIFLPTFLVAQASRLGGAG